MERQACQGTEKLVMSSKLNTVGLGGAFGKCRRTQKTGTSRLRRRPGSSQHTSDGDRHGGTRIVRREPRGRVVSTTAFKE